ncbi:MAG TPA: glucose-6-phosphate isomerase [Mycobacteriales bacterium]|nr:glucose-6-phosphate isomerase [Mycobacteriales bacterium]
MTDLSVEQSAAIQAAVTELRARAEKENLAARLAGKDPTLWGPEAESEATIRLGWLDAPRISAELLPRLDALRDALRAEGLDHVVLAGMGGSSLAPEVITRSAGAPLTVLDTTDPGQVAAAIADRLEHTVVVVSSKSGGTTETDSHRRAYLQAFRDAGLSEEAAGRRFVVVTDPGSPLEQIGKEMGAREVVLADPNVGGRYSALTAFGLVPSALAGVNVAALLAEAEALLPGLGQSEANPALDLGLALGAAYSLGRDKVVLADAGSGIVGFGDWAEQLIAESTGKQGKGLLPVVVEGPHAAGTSGDDVSLVLIGGASDGAADRAVATISGPLGAQLMAWEYATAVAGWAIGIDPFDQPNVQESKDNTKRILAAGLPATSPAFTEGAVEVYADAELLGGASTLQEALRAVLNAIPASGYLAVMAYLDRQADASAADLRGLLASRTEHAVTFGWAPRFLHSTGQYHKGGPAVGTYLQITGTPRGDLAVPGQPFTFSTLQAAQAAGDLQALAGRGRPVLRLHLTDRAAGLGALFEAIP